MEDYNIILLKMILTIIAGFIIFVLVALVSYWDKKEKQQKIQQKLAEEMKKGGELKWKSKNK